MSTAEIRRSEKRPWVEAAMLGDGPPLLALPTSQGDLHCLLPAFEPLADEYRVVLTSFRGERGHETDDHYELGDVLDDVLEVMELAGLGRTALVGTSFGGVVALAFALREPDRVDRLVLNVTTARARHGALMARVAHWLPRAVRGWLFHAYAVAQCAPELLALDAPEAWPALRRLARQGWSHGSPTRSVLRRVELVLEADFESQLAKVACPTLVISGEATLDGLMPRVSQQALLDGIPRARHAVLEGTGHLGLLTAPERLGEIVRGFVVDGRR